MQLQITNIIRGLRIPPRSHNGILSAVLHSIIDFLGHFYRAQREKGRQVVFSGNKNLSGKSGRSGKQEQEQNSCNLGTAFFRATEIMLQRRHRNP